MSAQGLPGGGNFAVTTSPVAIDLSALAGHEVVLWCDEGAFSFSFTDVTSTSTTLVTGPQAASLTALVADTVGEDIKVFREIRVKQSRLVVAGSVVGTLRVKPVRKV